MRDSFHQEVDLCIRKRSDVDKNVSVKDVSILLWRINEQSFPSLFTMMKVLTIIAVAKTTVEKGSCTLKKAKNIIPYLKVGSGKTQCYNTSVHSHKAITLDYDAVTDTFARKTRTKLLAYNPLTDE